MIVTVHYVSGLVLGTVVNKTGPLTPELIFSLEEVDNRQENK